ncbi:PfkB family carbohydrate kinase [Crocinitomix algicola]|uniref:PfkB family carbohydrate kinase n=1 Tax=Crocinitomix algicola TaxID=1740263 RepID=UPI0008354153|nr:PfkB family carbohydrate kinase [Crocinitomix algicola]
MDFNQKLAQFVQKAKSLNVLIIGETIIDEFVEVIYQGQSMKSFCPVFQFTDGKKDVQIGGSGAIANHLKDFVAKVDLITNTENEIVKTRFVDKDGKKKHIEFNKIDNKNFGPIKVNSKDYDVVIVADFGHGFCDQLEIEDGFHLMCQTNSYNFGFNRLSKWKKHIKKSVCLDLREASLQINKKMKSCSEQEALEIYNYELNTQHLFITLGGDGAMYTNGKSVSTHPVIKSKIVDTIGAGDTFFAFACLMSHLEFDDADKLTIPSLAASLSTTWLCNEQEVTQDKLMEYGNQKL